MYECRRAISTILSAAFLFTGCESDELAPAPGFKGEECKTFDNCNEGTVRLDAGTVVVDPPDGGLPPPDAGFTDAGVAVDAGVTPDAGPPIDAGFVDAGTPDSGVPPSTFLNLSGTWRTQYVFDISNYVLGIGNLANELDFLDQALQGNLNTGFPLVDQLVMQVLQQYVPPWVVTLIDVLNDVANFLEQMEAVGTMNVSQDPPATPWDTTSAIHANETWHVLYVYIIDNCPLGRNDPSYPACARFGFNVTSNPQAVGPLDILVEVQNPFHGTLQAGTPEADFEFSNRDVRVDIQKLVLLVLDLVTNIATNGQYTTLRAALGAAVNCAGLAARARNFAENDLGLGTVVGLLVQNEVNDACNDVLDDMIQAIGTISVTTDLFEIDHQYGHAIDRTPQDGQNRPEELQNIAVPSTIDGSSLSGRWQGVP